MGQFSRLAKADGYVVTLVPPESYFDPYYQVFLHTM